MIWEELSIGSTPQQKPEISSKPRQVKLTSDDIRIIIERKKRGVSSRELGEAFGISQRRVNQLWKEFRDTGCEPFVGRPLGRPEKPLDQEEEAVVREAYGTHSLGARKLEPLLETDYGLHIPHNRIHRYLLKLGYASENERKKGPRAPKAGFGRFSLDIAFFLLFNQAEKGDLACAVIDGPSKMVLDGEEGTEFDHFRCKKVFDRVVGKYWDMRPIKELVVHFRNGGAVSLPQDWEHCREMFCRHVMEMGVKVNLISDPSDGRMEYLDEWIRLYQRHRNAFATFGDFSLWYNRSYKMPGHSREPETPRERFLRLLLEA